MSGRDPILAEEGSVFPAVTYRETVLEHAYDNAKRYLLDAMLAANQAHLIMLAEQGLVTPADARVVMNAVRDLDPGEIRASSYTGEFEDLFFYVEHLIREIAEEDADPMGEVID